MAGTSAASPVTETGAAWPGLGWLRIGVLAGLVGGLGAAAVNGVLGERVLGEAIRLEEAGRRACGHGGRAVHAGRATGRHGPG